MLVSGVVQATPDKLRSSYSVMTYHKEGPACGRIPYDLASSKADCEYPLDRPNVHLFFQVVLVKDSLNRLACRNHRKYLIVAVDLAVDEVRLSKADRILQRLVEFLLRRNADGPVHP